MSGEGQATDVAPQFHVERPPAPKHWLEVTYDGEEDYTWRIRCERLTSACAAWEPCVVAGCDSEALERLDEEGVDLVQHDVDHQQIDGEWMTATDACFARVADFADDVHEMVAEYALAGGVEHEVEVVSEDYDWHNLVLVRRNNTPVSEANQ